MNNYDPKEIEAKWQKIWEEKKTFSTPKKATKQNKCYVLPQLPYPSGSGLHVGHAEVYTACDIYARYQRMKGNKVLQVIGWDSFGLPAENYAIKTNIHPRESTNNAIENFRSQIKSLGISVDWDREVGSHNPDYYKFTQWFFLLMYERGLAYRKKQTVNWCDGCKTVLANEQVIDGRCERSDDVVEQREMEQWYLKITDYADKLLEGLDRIDWPEETKKRQKDWIGKSQGALVKFKVKSQKSKEITVFTTRPDTIFGATYLVLAPENKLIGDLRSVISNWEEVEKYIEETKHKTELDRKSEKEKTGVELKGIFVINPATGEEIPVWIADYVLTTYGTGAIMAVPAHDERDFEFAKKFDLSIRKVVVPPAAYSQYRNADDIAAGARGTIRIESECFVGDGENVNSGFLNGLKTEEAKEKIIVWLEEKGIGERKTQYKLRDWSVSRQRFWGAPIPMLRHEKTGELKPADFSDLPVLLPDDVDFKPTGQSPLTYSEEFQKGVEEKYGKGWRREVDTLDTFMCSSWYYYRYLDPKNEKEFVKNRFGINLSQVDSNKKNDTLLKIQDEAVQVLQNTGIDTLVFGSIAISLLNRGFVKEHNDVDLIVWTEKEQDVSEKAKDALINAGFDFIQVEKKGTDDWYEFKKDGVLVEFSNLCLGRKLTKHEVTNAPFGTVGGYTAHVAPYEFLIELYTKKSNQEFVDFLRKLSETTVNTWMPVDFYLGGPEHVNGHLLYSRFFTKVLFDAGYIDFDEPFMVHRHQGLILGEDGRKMSKRWGNVINPTTVVDEYGADTLRMYEMFMGPLEDDKPWDTNGVKGVRRFLDRVWKVKSKVESHKVESGEFDRKLHQTIKKVGDDIANLSFNTSVAKMMELVNEMAKVESISGENFALFVKILSPFAPHIAEELWNELGNKTLLSEETWPAYDEAKLVEDTIMLAVQVNGKVRGTLEVAPDAVEDLVMKLVYEHEQISKWLENKQPKKIIYVPGKILNIVV